MANKLSPLAMALNRYVLEAGKVHADDIPVPVQAPGSGKIRTGRLWVYVRDDRNTGASMPAAVWFAYSLDRRVPTRSGTRRNTGVCCRRMRIVVMIHCTQRAG